MSFKVGQRIKIVPREGAPDGEPYYNGSTAIWKVDKNARGVIVRIDSDGDLHTAFKGRTDTVLVDKRDAKLVAVKAKAGSSSEWSFHSASPVDINYAEIIDCLTRKNPIALITNGDRWLVAVKRSLIQKADRCNLPMPSEAWVTRIEPGQVMQCKEVSDFSQWIAWAKVVKNAKWPEQYAKKTTVKIIMPSI